MMPLRVEVLTAHVDARGKPCLQGGDVASLALPDDYPRDDLVADEGWWDLPLQPAPGAYDAVGTGAEPPKRGRKRKKRAPLISRVQLAAAEASEHDD